MVIKGCIATLGVNNSIEFFRSFDIFFKPGILGEIFFYLLTCIYIFKGAQICQEHSMEELDFFFSKECLLTFCLAQFSNIKSWMIITFNT